MRRSGGGRWLPLPVWKAERRERRYRMQLVATETLAKQKAQDDALRKAKERRGWSFAKASMLLVFATQAPLLFVVCLPAQLGQVDAAPPLGALAVAGACLSLFGTLFETVGDLQLVRFKRNPENQGQVMDRGLWRYTRHPNYFGDACAWWGIWLVAAETSTGLWSVVGPMLLTWTLAKWSGAPTIEGQMTRTKPGYADYVARTSGFVPWFPKRA